MINSGATPCFPNAAQGPHNIYAGDGAGAGGPGCGGGGGHAGGGMDSSSTTSTSSSDAQLSSLICSLSILKGKVHQVQSLVSMFLQAPNHCQSMQQPPGGGNYYASSSSVAVASSMGTLIQDIVVTASSMMFNCQQIALAPTPRPPPPPADDHHLISREAETETEAETEEVGRQLQVLFPSESFFWFGDHTVLNHNNSNSNNSTSNNETSNNETSNCTSSNYNNNNVIMSNNQLSSTTTTQGQAAGYINTNSTPHPRRSVAVAEPRGNKVVQQQQQQQQGRGGGGGESHDDDDEFDIIELDAADLLAKYTHYCQVCGKGFKRDANLRMHMRAHGDEYKSNAALSNPLKKKNNNIVIANNNNNNGTDDQIHQSEYCSSSMSKLINNNNNNNILPPPPPPVVIRKYSCPQEGCRWNKKHAKFQPLKSMICVKNHYKRSHCPKLYVCKRCNRKQFSVLSDLRTHEKHCGDLQWQCSCGTTFSRKDKLMGHVALFVGHTPMIRQQPQGKVNDDHRPIQIIQGDVQR